MERVFLLLILAAIFVCNTAALSLKIGKAYPSNGKLILDDWYFSLRFHVIFFIIKALD